MKTEDFRFDGPVYEENHDKIRLTGQLLRIFEAIKDGNWYTLNEIHAKTEDPHASISAQLRHLRKERFGSHIVDKKPRGKRNAGIWQYKLTLNKDN